MTYGVIGGDRRQAELAALLAAEGNAVASYGLGTTDQRLEDAARAEVVLLPLPLTKETGTLNCERAQVPLKELFAALRPDQRILAGQVKAAEQQMAAAYGLTIVDYFLREELTIANAAITADCAIRLAQDSLGKALPETLVLGFGRIGKLLCSRLQRLGVRVTAAARKAEDLAWAQAYGYEALHVHGLPGHLSGFGLVFNTVPAAVLDAGLAAQLLPECLCIDLASQKGIELPEGERCIWARGLPGRMAPKAAAQAIRETVGHILMEQRGEHA